MILPGTRRRLQLIHGYLTRERSRQTADRVLAKIKKRIEGLSGVHAYQEEDGLRHLGLGHRRMIEGPYKIIFRVIGDTVVITDVFHTKRDPSEMRG